MPLSASSNVILIPSGSPSGTVTISWSFPTQIQLWERRYRVGPTPAFEPRSVPSTQLQVGSYTQTLRPGEVYEVRALRRDYPGRGLSDAEMARWVLDEILVHALGLPSNLQTDFNERVGGTFYRYQIATSGTPTHAIMEISTDQPVADAAGFRTMPNPMMTVRSFAPAEVHNLTTDDVIFDFAPEDRAKLTRARFALIRVSDGSGRWQQVERPVKTLDRKLTIDFHTIDVQGLGEAPSETEAQMRFLLEVWFFDGQNWGLVKQFDFANHNVTLLPFPVRNHQMNPVVVVGPRPIRRKEVAALQLHVDEFDPWPFEDESAMSHRQLIRVNQGELNENLPLNLTVRAQQPYDPFDTEQEIIVDLRVAVTVEHV